MLAHLRTRRFFVASLTRPGLASHVWQVTSTDSMTIKRFQSTAPSMEAPSTIERRPPTPPRSANTDIGKTPFASSPTRKYEYFQNVALSETGVAVIRIDCPGKSVNTISFAFAREAMQLWQEEIESNPKVKAVVWTSAKPGMFIAGADIFDIKSVENKDDLKGRIEEGINFFQACKKRGVPIVAAIDGPALGGGLEWALWCDYRICTDNPKTKLGLPEVKLGLLPGFGGTQNLHPVVGLQKAMDMMLTGKEVRAAQAKKMGLVDLVVAPASLESVAIASAEQLAAGTLKAKKKSKSWFDWILEDNPIGRAVIWNQIDKMVQKNTQGHYPAPYKIIQCVKHGLEKPSERFANERARFAELAATPESESLIGLFEGTTQLKKLSENLPAVENPKTVAVLGAGLMGAGIAQVSAEKGGYTVLLKDRSNEALGKGISYMTENWDKKLKKRSMTDYERNRSLCNIIPLTEDIPAWSRHFSNVDMVIEAVFENLELKQKIVADMEAVTPERCVFATNTSAIPIRDIAAKAKRPQNIIGMHYFSPVPNMPLLEIIPHDGTSDVAKATAFQVGTKQGKTCIVVKDVPGFYVNRCLGPYLVEVSAVVKDGVPLEKLDNAIVKFGMPVGPITLADEVGVDVSSHVAKFLSAADLGVRMTGGDVSLMEKMVDKGWLGKKSGQGFYKYGKKSKDKTIPPEVQAYVKEFATRSLQLDDQEIQDRVMSRFINEAVKCLEDGVIENPVVGDIGLVFGTGFAPFRGGPFRFIDQIGAANYASTMNRLAEKYGPQFEPCQLLKDYASSGKKFHKP